MHEPSVETLLRAYVNDGSEAAFTEVVHRCTGLVYATALRRVGGDAHLARDVTQLVFVDLARKARTLAHRTVIAGWLHHHTCFRAATLVRSEQRRRIREEKAAEMEKTELTEERSSWQKMEPWLDHALESLPGRDRDAILQRFFSGEALAGLGEKWGITEDAAQKRVARALERLRRYFAQRGIATTSAALASAFTANGVQGAPAGLAASATHLALVGAASTAGNGLLVAAAGFIMETKKLAIAVTVGTLATGIIVTQQRQNGRLRAELEAERSERALASRQVAPNSPGMAARRLIESPATTTVPPAMIASADVEAVMAQIIRDKLWETDHTAFQDLIGRIADADMSLALAYLADHTVGLTRTQARLPIVEDWARRSPALAAAWCQQLPPSADQKRLKELISNRWASSDPEAALRFAPSAEAIHQLALHSPERAESEALRLPPGDDRSQAIGITTLTKLEQDPRSVTGWIEKLEGDDRAVALSAILPQLTESDPAAVASYIEKLPATERSLLTGRNFAVVWANRDPAAAASWSAALPLDSALRSRAIAGVTEIWAGGDPVQAAAWISRLPSDRAREVAATVYVDNVADANPVAAAAMVPQLGADAHNAAIMKIGRFWLKSDAEAARRWLTQMNLSEDQMQALETAK